MFEKRRWDHPATRAVVGVWSAATALLAVVFGSRILPGRRPVPALGLAMASSPRLGRRLAWIGRDRGSARCVSGRAMRLGLIAILGASAAAIGSVELTRRVAAQEQQPPDAPPDRVEVLVVEADTGRPLEGARLRVRLDAGDILLKADGGGKVQIDLTNEKDRTSLWFDVWTDQHVQQRHSFAQDDPKSPKVPKSVTVSLLPGDEALGGRVVDEVGNPIAGVTVATFSDLGEKKEPKELAWLVTTVTDERGQWRSRSFRKPTFAHLQLSHPDYLSDDNWHRREYGRMASDPPRPDEKLMESLRDFSDVQVMTRGIPISGRVIDEQGQPVVGAEVGWIETRWPFTLASMMPKVQTDDQGRFRFEHARPGRLVVQATKAGRAPDLRGVEEGLDSAPVTLRLAPARVLSGTVVDTQGKPIPKAYVSLASWRGFRALDLYLRTDAEGRFRWDDAPTDALMIHAGGDGYESIENRITAGDPTLRLVLKRQLEVTGTVRDAANDRRIDDAGVVVGVQDPATGKFNWSITKMGERGAWADNGRLTVRFEGETAAAYRFRVAARGYEVFESRTFRHDEGAVTYDVKLVAEGPAAAPEAPANPAPQPAPRARTIAGAVHRPDGNPLEGADVAVTYFRDGQSYPRVEILNGTIVNPGPLVVHTDDRGRFEQKLLPGAEEIDYSVVVVHPDFFAEVGRYAFRDDPTIVARPWGRIEGVSRVGVRNPAGLKVFTFGGQGSSSPARGEYRNQADADAEGRFTLERIPPGEVRIERGSRKSSLPDWGARTDSPRVAVKPGETTRVELGVTGRPVIARIVPPEGFPPEADFTIHSSFSIWPDKPTGRERLNGFRLLSARLQADGTIRAEEIPPGDYRLELSYTTESSAHTRTRARYAEAERSFTVPEPGGDPIDLGELHPKLVEERKRPE